MFSDLSGRNPEVATPSFLAWVDRESATKLTEHLMVLFIRHQRLRTAMLTSGAEASYWAAKMAHPKVPVVGPPRRGPLHTYETEAWWSGEALTLSEEVAMAPEVEASRDPCWWNTDECETPSVPISYVDNILSATTVNDVLTEGIPCVTTDDGCTLEARAGIVPEQEPLFVHDERLSMDPCFWDDACMAPS